MALDLKIFGRYQGRKKFPFFYFLFGYLGGGVNFFSALPLKMWGEG